VLVQDELNHPSLVWLNRRLRPGASYPIVSVVHHLRSKELRSEFANSLYRRVERDYLNTVDGFIYNSQTTRSSVEELVGNRKPSVTAYPGKDGARGQVGRDEIDKRAWETGPLRVLFVGSLIPRKELHTLIAALAKVPQDMWNLTVVGSLDTDPAYVQRIARDIATFSLRDRITLVGSMPLDRLVAYYASSHVLAVPSSYEGFGIVYLEGMGFGLPAIASTTGAAHEIVTHDTDGFLVNPGDAETLAKQIATLARDRARLVRMSYAALEKNAVHPTWNECAATIRKFLQEMIG
jgi:glycosyltransferase involved in cell wall biosynthesis